MLEHTSLPDLVFDLRQMAKILVLERRALHHKLLSRLPLGIALVGLRK